MAEGLQKFNVTNLARAVGNAISMNKNELRREIKEYIWPRLGFLHGKNNGANRYFLFEDSYVETEWKDMISVHYINTSYKVSNTVMRVHIFSSQEITEKSYLGFFTLRKIDEVKIMLSYIYPNWKIVYYDRQPLCAMTYKKKVHIKGNEIVFYTYPLFVQDNVTVACAQANLISMTQYLHQRFDTNEIRILDLNRAFSSGKTKLFPTTGLTPLQIIEIFNYYNISIGHVTFCRREGVSEEALERQYEDYRKYIDFSIESGIPVMLGITIRDEKGSAQRHVVQIIGHTKQSRESYIIYDDSGYFFKKAFNGEGFVAAVPWEKMKPHIFTEKSFIIYPIHEKVYLLYDDFRDIFLHMYKGTEVLRKLEEQGGSNVEKARIFLADNRDVKAYLQKEVLTNEDLEERVKKEIDDILVTDMPYYVWFCEVPLKEGYFIFIANSTYSKMTTKNIFYNKIPIFCQKQLGLLNYNKE